MTNIKKKIFDTYSRNLEFVINKIAPEKLDEFRNKYMCPLCRRIFSIESLDTSLKEHLTIEDIPPKSVGWKRKMLTCKRCNNQHGSKIDSHLPIVTNKRAFANRTPNKSIDIKLKYSEDTKINAQLIYRGNSGFEIFTNPKVNNPLNLLKLNSLLEKNEIQSFELEFKTDDIKKAKLSIIRAAYLWGFHQLGYAFIFNPYFDNLNQQLGDCEKKILPLDSLIVKKENFINEGVYIIKFSENIYQYAISMFIKSNEFAENVVAFFPTPLDSENRGLDKLREMIDGKSKHSLMCTDLNSVEILHDSEKCIFPLIGFGL